MSRASDRRKLVMATAAVAGSRALGFPLALLVSMWLTRVLPRDEFAFFGVLATFSILFSMFAQAGFQTGVVRMLGEAEAGDKSHPKPSIVYASVLVTLVFSLLLAALFYVAGRGVLPDIGVKGDWLFLLAAGLLVARSVNTVTAQALRGIGRVGMSANFSGQGPQGGIVRCVLILAGFALATHYSDLTLESAIWISIVASVLCTLGALVMVLRHTGFATSPREVIATADARKKDNFNMMLSEALVYWTSASAALVIGGMIVEAALMAGMVAAFQLRNVITSPLTIVAGAVPNILIRLHREGDREELEKVLRSTASAAFAVCLAACGFLALIGPWGFRLLFGADYGDAYYHFVIMAVGISYFIYCGLSGQALLLLGDTSVQRAVMIKVLAITTPLYVVLAYWVGPYGLSIGLAVSMILQQALLVRAVRKSLGVDTRAYLDPREYLKAPAMLKSIMTNKGKKTSNDV
ncbi:lipopolysaccharide biosynthesis protein [Qipengyuania gelatinilytica]|uniref:Oligosaccharide flippase family protein n=1 Tax=Qipengyuania gelatinilytica TaxID=2867231 RepID=A0ABX9A6K3_9SPHN|nr:oligosaccharide flippase family protein [Qipengyuania gelatinilytica]QZD95548.1 oligosaccharide flippase family protein [Qipengyuania gelatinilytica]